jgi:hypothetical protein
LYAPWLSFPLPLAVLGINDPSPPATLPFPDAPSPHVPVFRVDNRHQGLLFEL